MFDEFFQINVEANLKVIEDIFNKPNISESFEKGYRETEQLIRSLIVTYRIILLVEIDAKYITFDDELIMSKFKEMLRGQILVVAIANIFKEQKLNVEDTILELTDPDNMIQLYPDVLDTVFTILLKDASFDIDESQSDIPMFS